MYVKSIVLDGFKSYGTRTEIKGFDREFNAITGLNGTGKSNILDSICFVLGITNLTNVRVNNAVDLIYKCGQAHVTKATVTILFDNTDPENSPMNYEHHKEITVSRQIVVGGKNKYMINGISMSSKQIADFFSSVHLNVNNPHFLIMQGRITKVLNMKPPEILSMIEEAAGTRLYENKKIVAQKTVEKKDSKLKEMDEMFEEQINPQMQRLKDERSQYQEFQKIQREMDSLERITTASFFLKTETSVGARVQLITACDREMEELKNKKEGSLKEIDELNVAITELGAAVDKEGGESLKSLEAALKEKEGAEAVALAEVKSMQATLTSEERRRKQGEKELAADRHALEGKKAAMAGRGEEFEVLRTAEEADRKAVEAAEARLEAANSGLVAADDGTSISIQDQLMGAKQDVVNAETEVQQCQMELEHAKKSIGPKKAQLRESDEGFSSDQKELESKEKELNNLKKQLERLEYVEGQYERLQEEERECKRKIDRLKNNLSQIGHQYPQLRFDYTDPEPNFDRSRVHGLVAKLFRVKDPRHFRALETAAGGKLFNVVVTDENISSKLIQRGNLVKRTTFAPLNKIQGSRMNINDLRKAQNLVGKENVLMAQDLIEYDSKYERLMSYVFGQHLVCPDGDIASRICDSNVNKVSVTLDGDVYNPSGIISGGAEIKSASVLTGVGEVERCETELHEEMQRLKSLSAELSRAHSAHQIYHRYSLAESELEMVRGRLQQTSHYQLKKEIEDMEKMIADKTERIKECKKVTAEKTKKVAELEHKMKNLKSLRDQEVKSAKANLDKAQKKAEQSRKNWQKREQEFETLRLEIEVLEKTVETSAEELKKSEENIIKYKEELAAAKLKVEGLQNEVKAASGSVKSKQEEITKKNSEIQKMNSKKAKLEKDINNIDLKIRSMENERQTHVAEREKLQSSLENLVKKYRWIETDREYFGQPGGMYDFAANNPAEASDKLKKLNELKDRLGKSLNAKAMDILGHKEEQFQEVMNRKEMVEDDRSKILSVIEELDVKKEEVMRTAWEQVNQDFNSILGTLLPGSHAKLQPVEGKEFLEGLRIRVGFGGVWKESLDELSGGQRSLVALSLVLAMLLFKPAPLYILDEVDAALDQSHTQNIGQMLKKHFKQSQFIIVSLKDGMFSNANVLFRTKFVDGMSTVIRTTPNH